MPNSMDSILVESGFVLLNLLMQITVLSLAAIILSTRFKRNAAIRYSLLYCTLISLIVVCVFSLFFQVKGASFLNFSVNRPVPSIEKLLPGLDWVVPSLFETNMQLQSLEATAVIESTTMNSWYESVTNLPLSLFLLVFWLGGALVSTFGILRSLHKADRIAKRSIKLSTAEQQLFHSLLRQNEISVSELYCRKSTDIQAPVLVGVSSPVLLVPYEFFRQFNTSEIRAILCHEVAHVIRRDSIANFLQKVILIVFWFHPLVRQLDIMISRAREEVCDNYVLSQVQAVDYGEVLLRLNLQLRSSPTIAGSALQTSSMLGVLNREWNLEQRISDLLNQNREIQMKINQKPRIFLNVSVVAIALIVSACQVVAQDSVSQNEVTDAVTSPSADAALSQNPSPAPTLSPQVRDSIEEIQALMLGSETTEPDLEQAKNLLDTLRGQSYERMNDFEKVTLLNFYTNYYLSMEDYEEAKNTFELMLQIENIREDINLRILRSLAQLYGALENWNESINYWEQWRGASEITDHVALQGLSYASYQLELFSDALEHWQAYMSLQGEQGASFTRENYAYLNGLYFTLERWEDALETTKQMVLLYNDPTDWENLRAIYRKLDDQEESPDGSAA